MTAAEFVALYAERSGMTVEAVLGNGRRAVPCSCDYSLCEGWVLLNALPDLPEVPEPVVGVKGKELLPWCGHWSLSGGERSIAEMGRWPVLWVCDSCGTLEVWRYGD